MSNMIEAYVFILDKDSKNNFSKEKDRKPFPIKKEVTKKKTKASIYKVFWRGAR